MQTRIQTILNEVNESEKNSMEEIDEEYELALEEIDEIFDDIDRSLEDFNFTLEDYDELMSKSLESDSFSLEAEEQIEEKIKEIDEGVVASFKKLFDKLESIRKKGGAIKSLIEAAEKSKPPKELKLTHLRSVHVGGNYMPRDVADGAKTTNEVFSGVSDAIFSNLDKLYDRQQEYFKKVIDAAKKEEKLSDDEINEIDSYLSDQVKNIISDINKVANTEYTGGRYIPERDPSKVKKLIEVKTVEDKPPRSEVVNEIKLGDLNTVINNALQLVKLLQDNKSSISSLLEKNKETLRVSFETKKATKNVVTSFFANNRSKEYYKLLVVATSKDVNSIKKEVLGTIKSLYKYSESAAKKFN